MVKDEPKERARAGARDDDATIPSLDDSGTRPRPRTKRLRLGLVLLPALAALPFLLVAVVPADGLGVWVREDGIVEWSGAAAWLLAGTLFVATLAARRRSGTLNGSSAFWLSGLALMCLLAAGEEISWGQRLFGYETPAIVARSNLQKEMNLHNLAALDVRLAVGGEKKSGLARWLTFGRISSLIWMGYLVAVPLLARFSALARSLVRRTALPLPPLAVALAGVTCYAAFRLLLGSLVEGSENYKMLSVSANEIKESMIAFLFACTAYTLYRHRLPSLSGDGERGVVGASSGARGAERRR